MQVSDSVVNGGGHGAQDSKSCRVGGKDAKRLGKGGGQQSREERQRCGEASIRRADRRSQHSHHAGRPGCCGLAVDREGARGAARSSSQDEARHGEGGRGGREGGGEFRMLPGYRQEALPR